LKYLANLQQPAHCLLSCRATTEDSHVVFIAPIQVQMLLAVAVPPCWTFTVGAQCSELLYNTTVAELPRRMATACAVLKRFKEFFISGQLNIIPLFRYSYSHFTNSPVAGV